MALPFTNVDDYKGSHSLPLNKFIQKDLIEFIGEYEPKMLKDLLGCELYQLFVTSLNPDNTSTEDRFNNIINEICLENDYCRNVEYRSQGIKELLKGFVYFYYGRTLQVPLTSVGAKKNDSENSKGGLLSATLLINNYNNSVTYYRVIQAYITKNIEEYPEYKGINKEHISII